MNRKNTTELLLGDDVRAFYEQMDNGECKYKMLADDGSYYCRTVASPEGAWQNSHLHLHVTEHYLVQSGWIAYASLGNELTMLVQIITEGQHIVVHPGVHHNLYMSANSVLHTIKYGKNTASDWTASPELDRLTHPLTEYQILHQYS